MKRAFFTTKKIAVLALIAGLSACSDDDKTDNGAKEQKASESPNSQSVANKTDICEPSYPNPTIMLDPDPACENKPCASPCDPCLNKDECTAQQGTYQCNYYGQCQLVLP